MLRLHLILRGWLLSMACSIGLGLMTVIQQWSGLPLSFGGVDIYTTIYLLLLICLW